ncbi:flagellin N-terminal helical domain-containing protein [Planctobacterium marinum]|uniref:flagellin N-terminal helical domain-containing protein n=1 Tax=Planctobacterium marinum TaxID=1631968 RepID=UPI001E609ABE|nr:flagellin [Planctobacterium marinum]MCC2607317.1 flagellin FliC [Planctobacterium marinum]
MALFVNTNVSALIAQNTLFDANAALSVSFERLSSGLRINRAADDSAGLQIINKFVAQRDGLEQSVRNANDAISMTQVAEGSLKEVTASLQRIRQLAVQSQSGINGSAERTAIQQEITALTSEMSRVVNDTNFAGNAILSGAYSARFQIGTFAGQTISVNLSRSGGFGPSGIGVGNVDITTNAGASAALTALDSAVSAIGRERADIGALTNRFQSTIRNLTNVQSNLASSMSRIQDADYAKETSELTRNQIIQQATVAVLRQANSYPQTALQLLI